MTQSDDRSSVDDPISVLVVDDEPLICEILKFFLETMGCSVHVANSGNRAISILESEAVEIVISDVQMPDGDGIDILSEINNSEGLRPAFFMMSGYCGSCVNDLIRLGALRFFQKPLNCEQLVGVIMQEALTRRKKA